MGDLKKRVEGDVLRAYVRYLEEDKRPEGYEITAITSECLRRAYYISVLGQIYDLESMWRMAVGKALHQIPIYSKHEMQLSWEGIVGIIDEYDPETGTLIEKKTARELPRSPYPHHVRQVEGYAVLLVKNQLPFTQAYILYIDVSSARHALLEVDMTRPVDMIAEELLARKKVLSAAIQEKIPPSPEPGWMCQYCEYIRMCMGG